jgi:hypothetical protein
VLSPPDVLSVDPPSALVPPPSGVAGSVVLVVVFVLEHATAAIANDANTERESFMAWFIRVLLKHRSKDPDSFSWLAPSRFPRAVCGETAHVHVGRSRRGIMPGARLTQVALART